MRGRSTEELFISISDNSQIRLALLIVSTACFFFFSPTGLYFLSMRTFFRPTLDTSEVIKILPSCFPIGSLEMMDGRSQDFSGCFGALRRHDFGRARSQLSVIARWLRPSFPP